MAGLQRTGATLLSSILNQNKDVCVPPASALLQLMVKQTEIYDAPANIDYPRTDGIANVIKNTPHAFYADTDTKYIIDKNAINFTKMRIKLKLRCANIIKLKSK